MSPFVVGLFVLMCLSCSPKSPAFVGQRETLLLLHEFSIVLLSSSKEKGSTPDKNPHGGETYVSTARQPDLVVKKAGEKTSCSLFCPPGVSVAKKIVAKVFLASFLHYCHQCTVRITVWL